MKDVTTVLSSSIDWYVYELNAFYSYFISSPWDEFIYDEFEI